MSALIVNPAVPSTMQKLLEYAGSPGPLPLPIELVLDCSSPMLLWLSSSTLGMLRDALASPGIRASHIESFTFRAGQSTRVVPAQITSVLSSHAKHKPPGDPRQIHTLALYETVSVEEAETFYASLSGLETLILRGCWGGVFNHLPRYSEPIHFAPRERLAVNAASACVGGSADDASIIPRSASQIDLDTYRANPRKGSSAHLERIEDIPEIAPMPPSMIHMISEENVAEEYRIERSSSSNGLPAPEPLSRLAMLDPTPPVPAITTADLSTRAGPIAIPIAISPKVVAQGGYATFGHTRVTSGPGAPTGALADLLGSSWGSSPRDSPFTSPDVRPFDQQPLPLSSFAPMPTQHWHVKHLEIVRPERDGGPACAAWFERGVVWSQIETLHVEGIDESAIAAIVKGYNTMKAPPQLVSLHLQLSFILAPQLLTKLIDAIPSTALETVAITWISHDALQPTLLDSMATQWPNVLDLDLRLGGPGAQTTMEAEAAGRKGVDWASRKRTWDELAGALGQFQRLETLSINHFPTESSVSSAPKGSAARGRRRAPSPPPVRRNKAATDKTQKDLLIAAAQKVAIRSKTLKLVRFTAPVTGKWLSVDFQRDASSGTLTGVREIWDLDEKAEAEKKATEAAHAHEIEFFEEE
ncbi:uncharacterized protein L969DRAFT_516335 [Mixia osmundae IAM 14324]|uniref:Uncharacterized protein n=1 Tax=Mixia osmundae (strain CBS 9802 / IAM 14324 / JCM 22182 / KY 12970) TaxID=764103 RepID=G7E6L7_MIXOS|nr:uncharacterized protein L969DRAFT_516335 [Mixia osmundae IAM 14324]KEI39145.1 hypothetical protein L969DRAFT_516335 [Mixia osmundae IAM 14324]GAA98477.1 hypothetical protein E5Q_05163 [Mixia osmundae IAM 14324]